MNSRISHITFFLLLAVLLSLHITPSTANINLIIGEEEENPFQGGICAILNCNSDGELGMFDYFENMWSDLSDINLSFGGSVEGGLRQRKLRGTN